VATVHAAREAARAASVDRRPEAASAAARRVLRRADVTVGDAVRTRIPGGTRVG